MQSPDRSELLLETGMRRKRRMKRQIMTGLATMGLGYLLLAVSPETESTMVLIRITLGFACLFAGFVITLMPAFERLFET